MRQVFLLAVTLLLLKLFMPTLADSLEAALLALLHAATTVFDGVSTTAF